MESFCPCRPSLEFETERDWGINGGAERINRRGTSQRRFVRLGRPRWMDDADRRGERVRDRNKIKLGAGALRRGCSRSVNPEIGWRRSYTRLHDDGGRWSADVFVLVRCVSACVG